MGEADSQEPGGFEPGEQWRGGFEPAVGQDVGGLVSPPVHNRLRTFPPLHGYLSAVEVSPGSGVEKPDSRQEFFLFRVPTNRRGNFPSQNGSVSSAETGNKKFLLV